MKTVSVLVAVLWAGTGWAEHIFSDGCNTCEQIGPSVYHCTAMLCVDQTEIQAFERKMEVHKNEACLEKMESAMRAMDEFTYDDNELMITDAVHRSKQFMLQMEIERLNRRAAAKTQWESVKRECWRKP